MLEECMDVFFELAKRFDSSVPRFFYNWIGPHVLLSHELFRRANHRWLVPAGASSFNAGTLHRCVREVSTGGSQQIFNRVDSRKANVGTVKSASRWLASSSHK